MGAGGSKPESSGSSKHVFSSNSPVQFSQGLVESLQSSSETDSSRAKTLELHIQERVAEELERLRQRETQTLADLEQRIAATTSESSPSSSSTTSSEDNKYALSSQSPLSLDTPLVPFAGRTGDESLPISQQEGPADTEVGRESVLKEIANLQSKLEGRRKMLDLDSGVEKAKEDVVTCLRLNDRRPLDCWREVETFKSEVARLERGFVDRIVG